jgi:geranylgeranyl pyrophosphate synthase
MQMRELAQLLSLPELPRFIQEVEARMRRAVAADNPGLREPTLRVMQGGGKRMRPILVIAAATSRGGEVTDAVLQSAVAVEFLHLATIVHDDIIDNAKIRWSRPTVHEQEGVPTAILVGDYLLGLAGTQAAAVSQEAARVIATTITIMCDGQSQELADAYNTERSTAAYFDVIGKKTASLTAAACRLGGLSAGLPPAQISALAEYGEAFGMAFQIIDDLLDLLADPETLGKPVGSDAPAGVYTLPVLLGLQGSRQEDIRQWLSTARAKQSGGATLARLLQQSGAIAETYTEIQRYNHVAAEALANNSHPTATGLAGVPATYLQWVLQKANLLPDVSRPKHKQDML